MNSNAKSVQLCIPFCCHREMSCYHLLVIERIKFEFQMEIWILKFDFKLNSLSLVCFTISCKLKHFFHPWWWIIPVECSSKLDEKYYCNVLWKVARYFSVLCSDLISAVQLFKVNRSGSFILKRFICFVHHLVIILCRRFWYSDSNRKYIFR